MLAFGLFDVSASQDPFVMDTYLTLVNNHRAKLGMRPVEPSPHIEKVAVDHSRQMARGRQFFGHTGWKQRCGEIKEKMGHGNLCGEIIARGQKNAHAVFRAWLNSPPHRQVIEGRRYTHTGLGYYKDLKGTINWTQLFLELR